ncbi:glycine cleavage system aminomethyltransferase GcvT [Cohnella sp. REN36]|uniref:glycine cleavage system aminomethyltransferase GcvT n=1 Tax=Cohnella sp. REN36 TaxID=2887347 RepID=UPI001D1388EA|nr:glycine cleavage system aminomethyltransferase GcvT [Cohnella sp. REN36]MCC3376168.1 glycine cleavage system aminomethyltransferase GcvT [Cohnella sp. REN36]
MSEARRTPLYPRYADYPAARCIDFGGWEMPVQFYGIQQEHEAVRTRAGLFDVSHMGELEVTGRDAERLLQRLTTNDVSRLAIGQAQYTLFCKPDGGVIDDLLVYKLAQDRYGLVVNAANTQADAAWLRRHLEGDVTLRDRSDDTALLALQGPLAERILSRAAEARVAELAPFRFVPDARVCGVRALVSRTGYTGEDGFEIYVDAGDALRVWDGLLQAGAPDGLLPVGLGARDTLRLEARLPLYGHELTEEITPLEAGLSPFVKLAKEGGFVGREALARQQEDGVPRKLVGVELLDRGIPRADYPVYAEGRQIGAITSGTQSPTLKRSIGLALVEAAYAARGTEVEVEIRDKRLRAAVVATPFYRRQLVEGGGRT